MENTALKVAVRHLIANTFGKPLYGYTSEKDSYLVEDYPYGFKLRCNIRYWIEFTPQKGYRYCSQTQDPRNGRWNKPKKETYVLLGACLYLDSQDHVNSAGLTQYSDGSKILDFVKAFPGADFTMLRIYVKPKIKHLQRQVEGDSGFSVNGQKVHLSEEDIGRAREELKIWEEVEKKL